MTPSDSHYTKTGAESTNRAILITGSNQGNSLEILSFAEGRIARDLGSIVAASARYETEPWGQPDQPVFVNQVLIVQTALPPKALLEGLLAIETYMGRTRQERYGPRTLDIDILFYNELVIDEPGLTIPHPRMELRRFVLEPLCEVAPDFVHPRLGRSVCELLANCDDPLTVNKLS